MCSFRVSSALPQSSLLLDVQEIKGSVEMVMLVMQKEQFSYPLQVFKLTPESEVRTFNVSGDNYELLIYLRPSSYSSGSYRLNARVERQFAPKAFEYLLEEPEGPIEGNSSAGQIPT